LGLQPAARELCNQGAPLVASTKDTPYSIRSNRQPTWVRILAEISTFTLSIGREDLVSWIENHKGIYHLAGNGAASRLQWAQAIMRYDPHKIEQITQKVQASQNQEFPIPAQRPLYSALDCKHFYATFGPSMPEWEKTLNLAMELKNGFAK